jgi:hypothetical protein
MNELTRKNGRRNERTNDYEWMNEWMNEWIIDWMNRKKGENKSNWLIKNVRNALFGVNKGGYSI